MDSKYYNKYTSEDASKACNGMECISHGLTETSRWYDDNNYMLEEEFPWLVLGGYNGDGKSSGIFAYTALGVRGNNSTIFSFRLVLSPNL